jgi:cytochrome c
MYPALIMALLLQSFAAPARADDSGPGQAMLQRCEICHSLAAGGPTKVGPDLHGIFGRKAGTAPGFTFSDAMKNSGIVWDDETLAKFLRDPKDSLPGNRMSFPGIEDDAVLNDLLGRLKQATQ